MTAISNRAQAALQRTDQDTSDACHRALRDARILRASNYEDVSVTVCDGLASLSGHVGTVTDMVNADRVVSQVPGVREVQNDLVADDDLVNLVAQALAHDERTRHETIFVAVRAGVVILSGQAISSKARAAAGECAGQVPSVRGVSNYIEAPGAVVTAARERVLQPRVGQEVFARDMSLGRVERVIVDPHNPRVVSLLVRGQFPTRQYADLPWGLYEPVEERRLVIPAAWIDSVTPTVAQLSVYGAEAAARADFKPADFAEPGRAWRPPYPFSATDCLWARS
jgi:osmotically-inducible protein OsmY